jgi:predicted nuclease of restriction endonuclease-like (RecB) superfamily
MTRAIKKPSRKTKPAKAGALVVVPSRAPAHESSFREIVSLIQRARQRAFLAVNTELIDLYWRVGEYISRRISGDGWGKNTVVALANFIRRHEPGAGGFSAQNLWRMRQFFETWRGSSKLSALLRELPWTHNLSLLGKCKLPEERQFYLRLAVQGRWSSRQLDRQIGACLFERAILSPPKVSPLVAQMHPDAGMVFKDTYLLDFLDLPATHSERQLQKALVANLKQFLIELGPDSCFAGEQLRIQVGGRDFYLDLLFFHRTLQCLVAFDLKVTQFEPEHLGKMEFYLEALDRDFRKAHERPSIGVMLCASKDHEVVEYALARSVSPALIAEYQTALPDKQLLRRKLHEFYELALPHAAPAPRKRRKSPKP